MNQAILSILSQKKSSHGNLRIRKFPVVRKYLRIRNFPVVRKKIYGSVSEAGELGLYQHLSILIKTCSAKRQILMPDLSTQVSFITLSSRFKPSQPNQHLFANTYMDNFYLLQRSLPTLRQMKGWLKLVPKLTNQLFCA